MNLYERLRRIFYVWLRRMCRICCHDIFHEDGLKLGLTSFAMYGLIFLVIVSGTYTITISEGIEKLSVFPYFGLAINVSAIAMKQAILF